MTAFDIILKALKGIKSEIPPNSVIE